MPPWLRQLWCGLRLLGTKGNCFTAFRAPRRGGSSGAGPLQRGKRPRDGMILAPQRSHKPRFTCGSRANCAPSEVCHDRSRCRRRPGASRSSCGGNHCGHAARMRRVSLDATFVSQTAESAHAAVACADCHVRDVRPRVFLCYPWVFGMALRVAPVGGRATAGVDDEACRSCHEDVMTKTVSSKGYKDRTCDVCPGECLH